MCPDDRAGRRRLSATMQAVSPDADLSHDFHDLRLMKV
jgi:hypothetical protein